VLEIYGLKRNNMNIMRKATYLLLISLIFVSCNKAPDSANTEQNSRPLLGIFGGMGPEATSDMFRSIIKLTPAEKDQDHIPTLVYSLPQVPDRMSSINNNDPAIIPYLVEAVKLLEDAGAIVISIPCNTVHYYYDIMSDTVDVPVINMITETVKEVMLNYPEIKNVGLLATTGTIETRLYGDELAKNGYTVIVPDDEIENDYVMKAVFGIKSGVDRQINEDLLAIAGENVIKKGAELIILGCTEIPLAFNPERSDVPVVNATEVLAKRSIEKFMELTKSKENN
jgi:aspartate racemase